MSSFGKFLFELRMLSNYFVDCLASTYLIIFLAYQFSFQEELEADMRRMIKQAKENNAQKTVHHLLTHF